MTFLPKQIGDKGQRYEAKYCHGSPNKSKLVQCYQWATIGWSDTEEGAQEMCDAWALRPSTRETAVIDRQEETRVVKTA